MSEDVKTRKFVLKIFDKVNEALEELNLETFSGREKVRGVIYIVVREDTGGSLVFGLMSRADILKAVLECLVNADLLTQQFAEAVASAWLSE